MQVDGREIIFLLFSAFKIPLNEHMFIMKNISSGFFPQVAQESKNSSKSKKGSCRSREGPPLPPRKLGFPGGSNGKKSTCNVGYLASIPWLGRFPGKENDYPVENSCLGNPMDRGVWWATIDGETKPQMQLNHYTRMHPFISSSAT